MIMKDKFAKIESNLKPRDYLPHEVARIVNPRQQTLYIKNKVFPIDVYASIDDKTGNDITVMIFLREESKEVYKKWCDYELN